MDQLCNWEQMTSALTSIHSNSELVWFTCPLVMSTVVSVPLRLLVYLQHLLHLVNHVLRRKPHSLRRCVLRKCNAGLNHPLIFDWQHTRPTPITTALYIFHLDVGELESITSFFWSEESGSSLVCKFPVNDVSICHTARLAGIEAIESGVDGARWCRSRLCLL